MRRSYGVYHYWWNGSAVENRAITAANQVIGVPTVVRTTGNRLNVFVRAHPSNTSYTANSLLHMTSIGGTNSWAVAGVGQQAITDFPSAVVDNAGETRVYARSETGELLEARYHSGGWNWSTISTVG
ncbi:hypothetical protein [Steroidobacter cummioxidans]|uniref:hypothetical protein n=1 Tax=Steroidobacter cummioxidans TaxID=1803913 RepID=UPI000E320B77|nr:hypothetical protein [Steroidobacter cummioxidans]